MLPKRGILIHLFKEIWYPIVDFSNINENSYVYKAHCQNSLSDGIVKTRQKCLIFLWKKKEIIQICALDWCLNIIGK